VEAEPAISESQGNEPKPLFIAKELPNGVRFVATPTTQSAPGVIPPLFGSWIASIIILLTASAIAVIYIERTWGLVSLWMSIASLFFLLQLAWEAYVVSMAFWRISAFSRGKFVIELAGDRLKTGHRWGPFWLAPKTISIPELTKLLIVRHPSEFSGDQSTFNWDLVAQHRGGLPISLVSEYDEPKNVRTVAKDLHARLATSSNLSTTLPPLQEELWLANSLISLPSKPPSSGRKSMLLHLAGSFGLGCIVVAVASNPPTPPFFLGISATMILIQGLALVLSVFYLRASRNHLATTRGV